MEISTLITATFSKRYINKKHMKHQQKEVMSNCAIHVQSNNNNKHAWYMGKRRTSFWLENLRRLELAGVVFSHTATSTTLSVTTVHRSKMVNNNTKL